MPDPIPPPPTTAATRPPDPHTPPLGATPILSSASPDTPSKRDSDTPHIVQTPKMKGGRYTGIGVGVGAQPRTGTTKLDAPVESVAEEDQEKNEGLGYGIELDQYELRELGMDRAEGSSSSSAQEVVLDQAAPQTPATAAPAAPASALTSGLATSPVPAQDDKDVDFPDMNELQRISSRLNATEGTPDREELLSIARSLLTPCLEQLPFLYEQIEAQKATIRTMQQRARLASKLNRVERDRRAAERAGWHREMKALISTQEAEIAAGKRPKKGLDLDVGYHQELEAANKRLEMDNRLMAPRLADTQKQIDKLVTELRHLRSNVILSTSDTRPANANAAAGPSSLPLTTRPPGSPSKAAFSGATMGDARSEHLLLAARKVRSMRAHNGSVGMLTLDELKRHGVVGPTGGIGYSEGYGGMAGPSSDDEHADGGLGMGMDDEEEVDRKPSLSKSVTNTPQVPRSTKKGGGGGGGKAPTTPKARKHSQQAAQLTTPGGSNFSDLLRAAEMVNRPQTPTRTREREAPMSAMSMTRTRMREEDSPSERGSPVKKARTLGPDQGQIGTRIGLPTDNPSTAEEKDQDASALDLLAQASQLDVAQGDTPEADAGPGPAGSSSSTAQLTPHPHNVQTPSSASGSGLEPPIDLHPSSSTPRASAPLPAFSDTEPVPTATPQARPRNLSNASELPPQTPIQRLVYPHPHDDSPSDHPYPYPPATDPPPGAFASPTGATVPGLGKYVHLSSSMPARRVRSPYLKWTVEEDELLARAVAIHGEKWDLVSKGVPTRSYHQVRQRWLRKTGAFDKKQPGPGPTTPADHHGPSALAGYMDDEREGSPTPQSGRTKKGKD